MPPAPSARGQGSNDWVVSGPTTASGMPLLANDPHLLVIATRAVARAASGRARLRGPRRGVAVLARDHPRRDAPSCLGRNERHWRRPRPVRGDPERRRDRRPVSRHVGAARDPRRADRVRGEPEPRTLTVRETRHGPIVTHGTAGVLQTTYRPLDRPYALRWTGHESALRPSLALDVVRARDFEEFRQAVLQIACPGQNFVYADVDGHDRLSVHGLVTHSGEAGDGTRPVPGWAGEHEWLGWIPLDELPHEIDPDRAFIATANDDIQPAGYPLPDREGLPSAVPQATDRGAARRTRRPRRAVDASDPARHGLATAALEMVSLLIRLETAYGRASTRR